MSTVVSIPSNQQVLAKAVAALEAAKSAESMARVNRLAREQNVIELLGRLPDEGTTRHDAGQYIVVVTNSMRRTVDADKLAEIAADIPEAVGKRVIRWKAELVTREMRYIQDNEPEIYRTLAKAITAKPAKPAIKVEPIESGGAA